MYINTYISKSYPYENKGTETHLKSLELIIIIDMGHFMRHRTTKIINRLCIIEFIAASVQHS